MQYSWENFTFTLSYRNVSCCVNFESESWMKLDCELVLSDRLFVPVEERWWGKDNEGVLCFTVLTGDADAKVIGGGKTVE